MHQNYPDIIALTSVQPKWWDECGVPRFCEFDPKRLNNIYANEAALLTISCQNCGREFQVAMSSSSLDIAINKSRSLREKIGDESIHYGDPPNIHCCGAGPTMNCMDLKVEQFWERPRSEWVRVPEMEIELPDAKELLDEVIPPST